MIVTLPGRRPLRLKPPSLPILEITGDVAIARKLSPTSIGPEDGEEGMGRAMSIVCDRLGFVDGSGYR
jgi:hypothetical protein